ncbi:iron ABC transporter permease [Variovorax dokdonensis]|uniref:Iron ABC transporter permease n=1 Tax=Variovorax dokdonensis TaxID=344883 RepID=A0ABT7N8I4_9BURK|nr:iron ABC transporter permease [Variovorax dokdonensis]MDM0044243.1 iron ABC transporter permease [Variovorax dokdonensis]
MSGAGMSSKAGFACAMALLGAGLVVLGVCIGSTGLESVRQVLSDATAMQIVRDIRLPRSIGAWLAGALLGLGGALAQGLFRNPLADPYLLGSASGANLGVSVLLVLLGSSPGAGSWAARLGMTGAAFLGAVLAVMVTLALARGVQQTLRLLLAGVVVSMVLGAVAAMVVLWVPDIMRAMQAFVLGTTGFLGWPSVALLGGALLVCLVPSVGFARALDALTLGEASALSLGIALPWIRVALIAALALATGAAVAQVGLVAFVGLVAPHLVRGVVKPTHNWLVFLSALMGGALLLAADVLARWVLAPQELPVGGVTALLGGGYLLWLMHRRRL